MLNVMKNENQKFWPPHLPRELTVPNTSISRNLAISAERYPQKTAIVFYDTKITYFQLLSEVQILSSYLQQSCNLQKEDRVLLDMQNSPQFIIAYYGILFAGGIVVPVNPMSVTHEIKHYCDDSGAEVAITSQDVLTEFMPLIEDDLRHVIVTKYEEYLTADSSTTLPASLVSKKYSFNTTQVTDWKEVMKTPKFSKNTDARSTDTAAILYTSGTTGKPKGCVISHLNLMHTLVGATLWESMNQDSVSLCTAPMFHVTGMQHSLNAVIYSGGMMVVIPRWDPEFASGMIEKYKCTHWANVPTMVVDLLAHPSTKHRNLSSLEVIFGGGSAMPERVAEDLYNRCGVKYMEGYGMTETISQTHLNPPNQLRKGCLGIPTFGTESIIIDPETQKIIAENEKGEILVRGPQIMKGYWNNPEANAEVFIEINGIRYLRTGDLGSRDSDGFFYIADRLKRMINAAGFKVWPAEVESILYNHPKIREVAVISSPHPRRGETVKAVISLKNANIETTSDEIIAWSRKNMAAYKVPRLVNFIECLPKSGTGKIQWRFLQDQEWENKL